MDLSELLKGTLISLRAIWNKVTSIESSVAKEATLNDNTQEIKDKIDNIDLSDVAKQGNNPNISITSIDNKLGNLIMSTREEQLSSLEYIDSQLI